MDTWLLLKAIEVGEREPRALRAESRGMEPFQQIREFVLTNDGFDCWTCTSGRGVVTGSAGVTEGARKQPPRSAATNWRPQARTGPQAARSLRTHDHAPGRV